MIRNIRFKYAFPKQFEMVDSGNVDQRKTQSLCLETHEGHILRFPMTNWGIKLESQVKSN